MLEKYSPHSPPLRINWARFTSQSSCLLASGFWLLAPQMKVTKVLTKGYENIRLCRRTENKPNQSQFHQHKEQAPPKSLPQINYMRRHFGDEFLKNYCFFNARFSVASSAIMCQRLRLGDSRVSGSQVHWIGNSLIRQPLFRARRIISISNIKPELIHSLYRLRAISPL